MMSPYGACPGEYMAALRREKTVYVERFELGIVVRVWIGADPHPVIWRDLDPEDSLEALTERLVSAGYHEQSGRPPEAGAA